MPDEVLAKALEFARREGVEPDDFHVVVHQREGSWIVSLSRKEPTLGGGYVVVVDRTTRTVEKLLPTQ